MRVCPLVFSRELYALRCDNRHLHLLSQPHNVLRVIFAAKSIKKAGSDPGHKNLRDLITPRIVNDSLDDILTAHNVCFDL